MWKLARIAIFATGVVFGAIVMYAVMRILKDDPPPPAGPPTQYTLVKDESGTYYLHVGLARIVAGAPYVFLKEHPVSKDVSRVEISFAGLASSVSGQNLLSDDNVYDLNHLKEGMRTTVKVKLAGLTKPNLSQIVIRPILYYQKETEPVAVYSEEFEFADQAP